jgi:hypothetical protein
VDRELAEIDCKELRVNEQLALAGAVTEFLAGRGFALAKGRTIVIDDLLGTKIDVETVKEAVTQFLARRKDSGHYSLEIEGETIVVHSPDPIAAARPEKMNQLPPNLYKCPYCPFVTQYEEAYVVHTRAHLFGAPV